MNFPHLERSVCINEGLVVRLVRSRFIRTSFVVVLRGGNIRVAREHRDTDDLLARHGASSSTTISNRVYKVRRQNFRGLDLR